MNLARLLDGQGRTHEAGYHWEQMEKYGIPETH